MRFVLASGSPRRAVLIKMLVDDVDIRPMDVDESAPHGLRPEEAIELIARKKALAASRRDPEAMILAADTALAFRGELLGKAPDRNAARLMLASLIDNDHDVITGLALAHDGRMVDDTRVATRVHIGRIPVQDVATYIEERHWMGKAGAYGIQDPIIAPHATIKGPWSNVVGLPLAATHHLLSDNGIECRDAPDEAWLRDHNPFDAS